MLTRFDASDDDLLDEIGDLIRARTGVSLFDAEELTLDLMDIIKAKDVS